MKMKIIFRSQSQLLLRVREEIENDTKTNIKRSRTIIAATVCGF